MCVCLDTDDRSENLHFYIGDTYIYKCIIGVESNRAKVYGHGENDVNRKRKEGKKPHL